MCLSNHLRTVSVCQRCINSYFWGAPWNKFLQGSEISRSLNNPSRNRLAAKGATSVHQRCTLDLKGTLWLVVVALSSLARIGGECLTIHSPPALFFFFKWRLVCAHWFHSLCQDQSMVARWAQMTVVKCSLTSSVWACFLIGSHTMPWQRRSQPTPTLLGQGCMHV